MVALSLVVHMYVVRGYDAKLMCLSPVKSCPADVLADSNGKLCQMVSSSNIVSNNLSCVADMIDTSPKTFLFRQV